MINLLFSMSMIVLSIFILDTNPPATNIVSGIHEPAYTKWSRLALEKAMERYPGAEIADYSYIGRRSSERTTTETFKLWIRENNREFGVFITIKFETENESIQSIEFIETHN